MKKLLLLMAACFVMVACGSEEKKEKQPETLVEYAEAMVAAAEAKDVVKYVDLTEGYAELVAELAKEENKEKKAEQEKAYKEWAEKNADALTKAGEFAKSKEVQDEMAKRAQAAQAEGDEE